MPISVTARQKLATQLHFQNPVEKADLLDPSKTQDDLIAMLSVIVAQGFSPLITSLVSDHGDDSALGPHGHARGFAIDLWVDPQSRYAFFHKCLGSNHYVTKIGLGGSFKLLSAEGEFSGTVVFHDNDSEHIHLQTA